MVLAGDLAAVLVNLGDGDLDGRVVLGLDDPVGGGALSGDVARSNKFKSANPRPNAQQQNRIGRVEKRK